MLFILGTIINKLRHGVSVMKLFVILIMKKQLPLLLRVKAGLN